MGKGSGLTLGIAFCLAGIVLIYAGWKNVPILSVFGVGSGTSGTGTTNPAQGTTSTASKPSTTTVGTGQKITGSPGTKLYGPGYGTTVGTTGAP